jgi:hypothetical protein
MDDIKQSNLNIYTELNAIKNDINNNQKEIDMNYVHQDELIGFLDDIKHDILELNKKFNTISTLTNKTISISTDEKFEIYNFLKDNHIDIKYINIILALDINSLEGIILLNQDDLIMLGIPKYIVEDICNMCKTFIEQSFQSSITTSTIV